MRGLDLPRIMVSGALSLSALPSAVVADTVLSDVNEIAQSGPYQLVNNVWNTDGLILGENFWQRVSYGQEKFEAARIGPLRDVQFSWWYDGQGEGGVRAYPEVIVGQSPWDGADSSDFASRIGDLKKFDISFDITTPTGHAAPGSNIAFDVWLTDGPGRGPDAITTEIMIWLSSRQMGAENDLLGRFVLDDLRGSLIVRDGFTAGTAGGKWKYLALIVDGDHLTGVLDMDGILAMLVDRGLVSNDDWVTGYELGAEVVSGSGEVTIKSLETFFSR